MIGHYLGEFSITYNPALGPPAPPGSSPSSSLLATKDTDISKTKNPHNVLSWPDRIYKQIPVPFLR